MSGITLDKIEQVLKVIASSPKVADREKLPQENLAEELGANDSVKKVLADLSPSEQREACGQVISRLSESEGDPSKAIEVVKLDLEYAKAFYGRILIDTLPHLLTTDDPNKTREEIQEAHRNKIIERLLAHDHNGRHARKIYPQWERKAVNRTTSLNPTSERYSEDYISAYAPVIVLEEVIEATK